MCMLPIGGQLDKRSVLYNWTTIYRVVLFIILFFSLTLFDVIEVILNIVHCSNKPFFFKKIYCFTNTSVNRSVFWSIVSLQELDWKYKIYLTICLNFQCLIRYFRSRDLTLLTPNVLSLKSLKPNPFPIISLCTAHTPFSLTFVLCLESVWLIDRKLQQRSFPIKFDWLTEDVISVATVATVARHELLLDSLDSLLPLFLEQKISSFCR
jgi:hypothetical protein